MTIEELKAQKEQMVEDNIRIVRASLELARVRAEMRILENPNLVKARVKAMLRQEVTDKLTSLNNQCEALIASMPIYSNRTKQERKWNPSKQYGLGNQVALLTGLLSGIQYSAAEHKIQLLALTGLSEDVIESTLEAFGSPAYYSNNYGIVIDESPFDIDAIRDNVILLEQALNITLDDSKLTPSFMRAKFITARSLAEKTAASAATTVSLSHQLVQID
jgi:hypothetical protein